jgi:hypothetical protein
MSEILAKDAFYPREPMFKCLIVYLEIRDGNKIFMLSHIF